MYHNEKKNFALLTWLQACLIMSVYSSTLVAFWLLSLQTLVILVHIIFAVSWYRICDLTVAIIDKTFEKLVNGVGFILFMYKILVLSILLPRCWQQQAWQKRS